MEENVKKALQYYKEGCNCSQSVFCAYADKMGIDEGTALKLMEAYGSGMGGLQEVCGAMTGAFAVLSFFYNDGGVGHRENRPLIYAKVRQAADEFRKEYDGLTCYDVLHGEKPKAFQCGSKIKDAVMIVDRLLEEDGKLP